MAKFKNEQGISLIEFTQNIQDFCPLGNDWYTNQITVSMIPDSIIPDYCDIDDFTRSLGGKDLIIEDVVDAIFKYIEEEYAPKDLSVSSYVNDAKHMPVTVVKTK